MRVSLFVAGVLTQIFIYPRSATLRRRVSGSISRLSWKFKLPGCFWNVLQSERSFYVGARIGEPITYCALQASRNTEIGVTFGYTATMVALVLCIFDQSLVLWLVTEMKTLRYNIAQVLAVQLRGAF